MRTNTQLWIKNNSQKISDIIKRVNITLLYLQIFRMYYCIFRNRTNGFFASAVLFLAQIKYSPCWLRDVGEQPLHMAWCNPRIYRIYTATDITVRNLELYGLADNSGNIHQLVFSSANNPTWIQTKIVKRVYTKKKIAKIGKTLTLTLTLRSLVQFYNKCYFFLIPGSGNN